MLKFVIHVQICPLKSVKITGTQHAYNSLSIRMNNTHANPNTTVVIEVERHLKYILI